MLSLKTKELSSARDVIRSVCREIRLSFSRTWLIHTKRLSAAWSLYARCSGAGEVVDLDGLRIANARHPWFLMNAALLTAPVRSQTHLATRARAALAYFGREPHPWFLAGSQQWLGAGA